MHYLLTLFLTLAALIAIVCYSFGSFYTIAREDAVTIGERGVSEEAEKFNNFLLRGLDVLQVTGLTIDYMLQMQENVIEGMATLIESRDGNTGQPVMSTKKYVAMIVQYMYDNHIYLEVLEEEAGSHFDPKVVEVFLILREEIERYLRQTQA